MGYRRDIAKNVAALLAGGLAGKVCRFIATVAVANALGTARFGLLAAVLGAVYVLTCVSDFGLSQLGTRELARDPEGRPGLVLPILSLKAVLSILACGLLCGASLLLPLPEEASLLLLASCALVLTNEVVFDWVFEGSGRMELLGLHRVLLNGAYLAAVVLFVRGPADAVLVPLIDAGSGLLGLAVCLLVWPKVWRYARGGLHIRRWPGLLRRGLHLALANVLTLATPYVGTFVLIALAGPGDTGIFKAAGTVVFGLISVGFLVSRAAYPVLSRIARASPESAGDALGPVFRLAFALSLPAAAGGAIVAKPLVLLFYKPEYAAASKALSVLVWSLPVALAAVTCQYALLAYDRARHRAGALALQVGVELAAGMILVPRLSYLGAAVAHLNGQAVGLAYTCWALLRVQPIPVFRHALQPALACVAMAVALFFLKGQHLAASVAVGAAVYAVALVLVGGLRAHEIASAISLLARRQR